MDEPIVPTLVDSVPDEPMAPADAPSPTSDETPADAPVAPADAPAAPELFDLPDGRKVDGNTLAKEWKENFLPDYTRKSQKIAEIEKGPQHINNAGDDIPEWQKPDYVPASYKEVIDIATKNAIAELQGAAAADAAQTKATTEAVDRMLTELKSTDPTLNEDALFQHAVKYGFRDLKAAHTNMVDMRGVIKDTEQRVLKDLKTRGSDPVAGGSVPSDGSIDPSAHSGFRSAQEYLSHIKGN